MSFKKDPDAVLDYMVDWSAWLATEEVITFSTMTVSDGITKNRDSHDDHSVTVWLSGGTVNTDYVVNCHITTDQGRQDERSFVVRVLER